MVILMMMMMLMIMMIIITTCIQNENIPEQEYWQLESALKPKTSSWRKVFFRQAMKITRTKASYEYLSHVEKR